MAQTADHTQVSKSYQENIEILKKELGIGVSYDIGLREFEIGGKNSALIFVSTLR